MKNEKKFYDEMSKLSDEDLVGELHSIIKEGKPYYVVKSLIIQQVQRERNN